MKSPLTTAQAARRINREYCSSTAIQEWHVRRLYELGLLSEPPKFGGKRMIDPATLPEIARALERRGWLNSAQESAP